MDLNELYSRHQIALIRAAGPGDCGERRRFHGVADGFASRIGDLQHHLGARATTPLVRALAA
jgi:hypothetical protein